jgi:hypothetical protein
MDASTVIHAGGMFNLLFAAFHMLFRRIFDWDRDLASLNVVNRAVMQILNLCLTFMFLAFAYLSFEHAEELLGTRLGNALLGLIAFFWLLRAIQQVIFFGLRHRLSSALFGLFLVGASLYAYPAWLSRAA